MPSTRIIRSGLEELRKLVRSLDGAYGAQRVEKAADEVPNLEKQYSQEALRQAFTGDNRTGVMTLDPATFEQYAEPLHGQMDYHARKTNPNQEVPTLTHKEYLQYLQSLHGNGGFDSVPFLQVNKYDNNALGIAGHEGRHRNRALAGLGDAKTLAILRPSYQLHTELPSDSRQSFIEAFMSKYGQKPTVYREGLGEFKDLGGTLDPEDYNILPPVYKQGGLVRG